MRDKLLPSFLFAAVSVSLTSTAIASTTWYVNGVSGSNSNTCASSTTACKTVGHAISLAASGDSIRVAAATYTEHLTININLEILGSGAKTVILDGGGVGRVVSIGSTAHVTISGVTITHGFSSGNGGGSGIASSGTLTLSASTVTGNLTASYCGPNRNCGLAGGGITNYSGAHMTIRNSTVAGNQVQLGGCSPGLCTLEGGGIFNLGTLALSNSTVSGNILVGAGLLSYGGGIYNRSAATISNSTIAGNTQGLWGAATVQDSILTNNGRNCASGVQSLNYNLSSDSTCAFSNSGDLNNSDPMLGPLQYNGGQTQTMALSLGSPAVDAGNPTGCTDGLGHLLKTDQRGKPRPDAEETVGCDMGAYEYQGALQTGHCVYVCPAVRCGELTGYCSGSVNGACRRTYDPGQCPVGHPAGGYGSSCGEAIDTTRTCTP